MTLALVLKSRFPDAKVFPQKDEEYIVQDDGNGPFIARWDEKKLGARPTDEQIAQWVAEYEPPVERRLVPKSLIVARLNAAGKLAAASAALNANLYARERWYAADRPAVYADDAEVLALLKAIGADPAVILAPE